MMVFTKPYDHLKMYRDAEADGLKQQTVLYYDWAALMQDPIGDLTDEQRSGRVTLGGIKLFMDGSVSNRTAWMKDAYSGSDDHGMTTLTDEAIQPAEPLSGEPELLGVRPPQACGGGRSLCFRRRANEQAPFFRILLVYYRVGDGQA